MKEIDPHSPINKIAKQVVSKYNEQEREFKNSNTISSMTKLPVMAFSGYKKHDLTGKKCGRFRVIGCAVYKRKNVRVNATRWVVRCSCGRYQMMTSKAVKNDKPYQMCVECRITNKLEIKKLLNHENI